MKLDDKTNTIYVAISVMIATAAFMFMGFMVIYAVFIRQPQQVVAQDAQHMLVDTRASETEDAVNPLANRTVSFVGLDDATLAHDGAILLENLPENQDFLMKFRIVDIDTGKEVYSTDLIPSGKHVAWTPSENLEAGVHRLSFMQTPFYQDPSGEYIPLTAGNNEVTITLQ